MKTKYIAFALVLLALVSSAACGKSGPTAPTIDVVEPGTPALVTLTAMYERPATAKCFFPGLCAPTQSGSGGVRITPSWSGTGAATGDPFGFTFTYKVNVPSGGGRYDISVLDPWLCTPDNVIGYCDEEAVTGKGITVNGIRLADGDKKTSFGWFPPDKIQK